MLHSILDEALIAHVGYMRDGVPVVLPFACARDGEFLLLHGSTGAGMLRRAAVHTQICATITHLNGLVVARSAFDNSMNYRSAVIFGVPEVLNGSAKLDALRTLVDHILPGRWEEVRGSTRKELSATQVLRLPLDQTSVKVRQGQATADEFDGENPAVWAGVIPIRLAASAPQPHPSVPAIMTPPESVCEVMRRLQPPANSDDSTSGS